MSDEIILLVHHTEDSLKKVCTKLSCLGIEILTFQMSCLIVRFRF